MGSSATDGSSHEEVSTGRRSAPCCPWMWGGLFSGHEARESLRGWLWFSHVIVLLLAMQAYPAVVVIWISFQKTKFFDLVGFVGLELCGILGDEAISRRGLTTLQ